MYLFESLKTYNRTVRLTAFIEMATKDFPKSTNYFVDRLVRTASSIQENFSKAHAQYKDPEKKNYYWRVRGSVQECFGLIEIASRQGFISPNLRDMFRGQLDELSKDIQDLIRGLSDKMTEKEKESKDRTVAIQAPSKN